MILSDISTFARYVAAFPGYLRRRMSPDEATQRLRDSLANRDANFLRVVERGIYGNPRSPYLRLLRWAGIELGDIGHLVAVDGLEPALGKLYDAGVSVRTDEIKGRLGIERPGLSLPASTTAFDNPLLARHYEARSSGSRGPRSRVMIDLEMLEHEAAYVDKYLEAFALRDRPYAVWRPVPPTAAAMKWLMRLEKLGKQLDRWFSHTRHGLRDGQWKFGIFTYTTVAMGRAMRRRFPWPVHVPADAPSTVTDWLALQSLRGRPATLDTMASSAVRVCVDAVERGVDISGTLFRVGGEPLTEARARIVAKAGCTITCFYSITELSFVGAPCADPEAVDDVHLLSDKIAAITRPVPAGGGSVDALIFTTLLPSSPKLMLNVESGDFAVSSTRDCSCPMGRIGFRHHLREIRSYEKLTSEGVTFLGTELLRILEEVLPGEFGGAPADYQFVEEGEAGLSRVSLIASPRLGPLDEDAVIERIVSTLRAYPGGIAMTQIWTQGRTLRVLRREPFRTASAKILPLHLSSNTLRDQETRS